ncbi:MAG: AarF/UbiB family protein [Ilumatobacteraceae bacterium]
MLRLGVFNGDPHPGNYRFSPDGHVTFLDFGMVKRWAPGEWEAPGAVHGRHHRRA